MLTKSREYFLLFSILPAKNMPFNYLNQTSYHPSFHTFDYTLEQIQVSIFHPIGFQIHIIVTN
jgi:hypothetical protein